MFSQRVSVVHAVVTEPQPHVAVIRAGSYCMGMQQYPGRPLIDGFPSTRHDDA